MEQVIKSFLGIFFMIMFTFIIYCFTSSSLEARSAESFMGMAVSEIYASNGAESVIAEFENEALSRGYEMNVDVYKNDKAHRFGNVRMKYTYVIPVIGINEKREISESF